MAKYVIPTIFYQSNLDESSAVEIPYIKSLSWANKTNNNGGFNLITPMFGHNDFVPSFGSWIRLSPGDTIMKVEKIEKECDEKGNFWYKLGGRPTQQTDEIVRDAKNLGYYFRYVYDGFNSETYRTFIPGTPKTMINSRDLLKNSLYEDDLGGFTDVVDDTIAEEITWGTIITGTERPTVQNLTRTLRFALYANRPLNTSNTNVMWNETTGTYTTHVLANASGVFPRIVIGDENNINTVWEKISYNGSWIKSDVTDRQFVKGTQIQLGTSSTYNDFSNNIFQGWWSPGEFVNVRTITLMTLNEYLGFMQNLIPPNPSGTRPAVVDRKIVHVAGGHSGYAFTIKAKGDVESRYKVDYDLGDTVSVNDTRLGLVYTGVVSGATETIDSSGYNVDIEIGVLGATVEQRLSKVI